MRRYNPKIIEPKWQKIWQGTKIYEASDDKTRPKHYVLEYFPYPSGASMHVGHVRNYAIGDAIARHSRMTGNNVLYPMGWDAFGLPAENYAIKTGISPQEAVAGNVQNFKAQLMRMGFSYDWSREIDSTDPNYYKWTQWFFLLLFQKGLAYQKESLQWWCPHDKTVLANEQVEEGKCWRCGHIVEKKLLKQWFFKITEYADRLADDLDNVDWSESIKTMQRNWIGRSKGAEITFKLQNSNFKIQTFTTRPDTIYGATFLVLAPEHKILNLLSISESVKDYIKQANLKSEIDRMETEREKTGIFSGFYATNPANGKKIPVWVADYVLPSYGTGAIMAVPAHDERDYEFAQKFKLPIEKVIKSKDVPFMGEGKVINSGEYDGMDSSQMREKIVADLAKKGVAKEKVNYKIHDWLISRQRYWGAPIPIIHCPKDGAVAVPKEQLPVVLPEMESYEPSGDGHSPLARVPEFVNTKCPKCGGPAKHETDTMDGFACSSWYFLRFADPHNNKAPFDPVLVEKWLPVDDYIGGAEHAVMHLLYARFWTKVMFDEGLVSFDEPFKTLRNQGMILAPDGRKMSKSWNNTVEPDELIKQGYGADSIRLMELFIGPWNQSAAWSTEGLGGTYRFLQRTWTLVGEFLESQPRAEGHPSTTLRASNSELEVQITRTVHKAIKKASKDMQTLGFNTAIAALMECVNELYKIKSPRNFSMAHKVWQENLGKFVQLLAPFAPHIAEELWQQLGNKDSVHLSQWPAWDENLVKEDLITLAVQVNGKLRAEIIVPADAGEEEAIEAAKTDSRVTKLIAGKKINKTIYVPGRLVSLVTD